MWVIDIDGRFFIEICREAYVHLLAVTEKTERLLRICLFHKLKEVVVVVEY
jgi:hypothetical protein